MAEAKSKIEISEGKIVDFIDGKLRTDSELEQIRQNFERTLIEEYRYDRADIAVDYRIKVQDGSSKSAKKVSLVVFSNNSKEKINENIIIVISIVKSNVMPTDSKSGTDDIEKILLACPNAHFACWTNGTEHIYFQKKKQKFDANIIP